MSMSLTFEQLEQQVTQLPPYQQLELLSRVSEKLSAFTRNLVPEKESDEKRSGQGVAAPAGLAQFDVWLAECNRVAELWEGQFDSAADLRRLREED